MQVTLEVSGAATELSKVIARVFPFIIKRSGTFWTSVGGDEIKFDKNTNKVKIIVNPVNYKNPPPWINALAANNKLGLATDQNKDMVIFSFYIFVWLMNMRMPDPVSVTVQDKDYQKLLNTITG